MKYVKLNLRFLRQGLLKFKVPENASLETIKKHADKAMREATDTYLIHAMSDFNPDNVEFFDEKPEICAIEDPNEDYKLIQTSDEWEQFKNFSAELRDDKVEKPKTIVVNFTESDVADMQTIVNSGESDEVFHWNFDGTDIVVTVGDDN